MKKQTNEIQIKTQTNEIKTENNNEIHNPLINNNDTQTNEIHNPLINNDDELNINDLYDIPPAPPILKLEDNEKFKNINGLPLNIEVRGERHHKKCYFKVKDVSEAFEMKSLFKNIQHDNTSYELYHDYIFFTIQIEYATDNIKCKKELYLTYEGMIKLLYISKNT